MNQYPNGVSEIFAPLNFRSAFRYTLPGGAPAPHGTPSESAFGDTPTARAEVKFCLDLSAEKQIFTEPAEVKSWSC